jgi:hypothetical protein
VLVFAIFFAVLALFGSLVGLGIVGQPMGQHPITSYGWSLVINGLALSASFLFLQRERTKQLH